MTRPHRGPEMHGQFVPDSNPEHATRAWQELHQGLQACIDQSHLFPLRASRRNDVVLSVLLRHADLRDFSPESLRQDIELGLQALGASDKRSQKLPASEEVRHLVEICLPIFENYKSKIR